MNTSSLAVRVWVPSDVDPSAFPRSGTGSRVILKDASVTEKYCDEQMKEGLG
jgi:hypothetical protein